MSRSPLRGIGGASLYQRFAAEREAGDEDRTSKKDPGSVRTRQGVLCASGASDCGRPRAHECRQARRVPRIQETTAGCLRRLAGATSKPNPAKTSGASFPSWPAYVQSQAALGDAEAIALLQRWRTRSQRQNPSPFRNAPSDPAHHGAKPPQALSRLDDASYHPARLVQALPASKIQRRPASRRASRR